MLEGRRLVKRFGGLVAVNEVDLTIEEGETRCIIGPNGAGKTTLFNLLTGEQRPTEGEVLFRGRRIDGLPPHRITRLGVARKFQVPAVFPELTVIDNVRVAANGRRSLSALLLRDRRQDARVWRVLEEADLIDQVAVPAERLSHGQVQHLEIAMVLATDPTVLLLDEPTAGMTHGETTRTAELLKSLSRERRLTTVIVEHDIDFIKMMGDKITVLHEGKVLLEGPHTEIERSAEVRRVYLGERVDGA
jgi:urea ABC transporter ATP-binding protein UrtD